MSTFETLNKIDVNEHTEKKGNLTYLSWAWAWAEIKKRYPDAQYTIYENDLGYNYHTDGRTAWVKTGVTIEGQEHIEYLPVMDYKNKSIPLDNITSFEVNKAIQRSITKACARHGLGLYIYAGEDLPEESDGKQTVKKKTKQNTEDAKMQAEQDEYLNAPADEKSRNKLKEYCEKVGGDLSTVLQQAGWRKDDTVTNEIVGKATQICMEIEQSKNNG